MPLELDYYYGNEAEQYRFYRVPKALFTDTRFKGASVEAKVLYGLFLDRMGLSVKNGWLDAEGRVYIIYTVAEVMETLGCAEQKAGKLLNELDCQKGIGLIERVRRGLGKPNVIYVKNFTGGQNDRDCPKRKRGALEKWETGCSYDGNGAELPEKVSGSGEKEQGQAKDRASVYDFSKTQIRKCENHKSGNAIFASPELRKPQANNTELNDTDYSDTNLSIYLADGMPSPAADIPVFAAGYGTGITGKTNEGDGVGRVAMNDGNAADEMDMHGGRSRKTDMMDAMDICRSLIKESIDYDILIQDEPYRKERLDSLVELIAEVCSSRRESIRVNQEEIKADIVKRRFRKLDSGHIRYVMDCLDKNTTPIGNIRAYTLSALFNAPVTIGQYYASLVRHDMAERAGSG